MALSSGDIAEAIKQMPQMYFRDSLYAALVKCGLLEDVNEFTTELETEWDEDTGEEYEFEVHVFHACPQRLEFNVRFAEIVAQGYEITNPKVNPEMVLIPQDQIDALVPDKEGV